jgi:hypothetical protein
MGRGRATRVRGHQLAVKPFGLLQPAGLMEGDRLLEKGPWIHGCSRQQAGLGRKSVQAFSLGGNKTSPDPWSG